jgi:hypothetical protein
LRRDASGLMAEYSIEKELAHRVAKGHAEQRKRLAPD